jgi:hypothetical protein
MLADTGSVGLSLGNSVRSESGGMGSPDAVQRDPHRGGVKIQANPPLGDLATGPPSGGRCSTFDGSGRRTEERRLSWLRYNPHKVFFARRS